MRPQLPAMCGGLACAGLSAITEAAYAYLTGPLLVVLLSGGQRGQAYFGGFLPAPAAAWLSARTPLLLVAAVIVALALVKGAAHFGQVAWWTQAEERVACRLRQQVFSHLLRVPLALHRRLAPGELLARFIDDVQRARAAVIGVPLSLVRHGLAGACLLAVALRMAPLLALVALAVLPPVAVAIALLSRRVRRAGATAQDALGRLAARAQRGITAVREVKSCGAEQREAAEIASRSRRVARWAERRARTRALGPLFNELCAALALGAVLLYAGGLVRGKAITAERVISFFAAVLLMYRPIKAIGAAIQLRAEAAASVARIVELLAVPAEHSASPLPRLQACARIRGVTFAYEAAGYGEPGACSPDVRDPPPIVLRGIDLELRIGELVALSGVSGAGKTTVLNLLCGLERPARGDLSWNGRRVDPWEPMALRQRAALVPQQPLLTDGSIAENLRYGAPHAPDAELWRVLEDVGLAARVRDLPLAVETPVGSGGVGLSVGEVQRLALARALLQDRELLLLDEPSSALDADNERRLVEVLRRLRDRRAILVVAHRPALLAAADRALTLVDGRIVALPDSERLPEGAAGS